MSIFDGTASPGGARAPAPALAAATPTPIPDDFPLALRIAENESDGLQPVPGARREGRRAVAGLRPTAVAAGGIEGRGPARGARPPVRSTSTRASWSPCAAPRSPPRRWRGSARDLAACTDPAAGGGLDRARRRHRLRLGDLHAQLHARPRAVGLPGPPGRQGRADHPLVRRRPALAERAATSAGRPGSVATSPARCACSPAPAADLSASNATNTALPPPSVVAGVLVSWRYREGGWIRGSAGSPAPGQRWRTASCRPSRRRPRGPPAWRRPCPRSRTRWRRRGPWSCPRER